MTASSAPQPWPYPRAAKPSLDELAAAKGITRPVTIADLPRADIFDTDEELDEFLAFVREQRHEQLA
ncbi:MAG TPA: hypothetical protein VGL39_14425 [Jatrophihabitantaceae bacterium]|jgi:hypothetical protein